MTTAASKMIRFIILCFCIVTLMYSVVGEVVKFLPCDGGEQQCINEVRVTPCKQALQNNPCKIKKGNSASIEVDFTANFSSSTLKSQPYWANGFIDLPLQDMDTDGCKTTTCPIVEGRKQTYTYELPMASSFPVSTYTVKWKLTGESADTQVCCFKFKIKLLR